MPPGLLVRLRPAGPWRFGSDLGNRNDAGELYHSDALFSAVTLAMRHLGRMDDWLRETALRETAPAVRFSSCFPWQGDQLYVTPPRNLWLAAAAAQPGVRAARFVPVGLTADLVKGRPLREQDWRVDPHSKCLLDRSAVPGSVFRPRLRTRAAVDRLTGSAVEVHRRAGVEFGANAGLWFVASFDDESAEREWRAPVEFCLRLLADSGFGGERACGWGRSEDPLLTAGHLPSLLGPALSEEQAPQPEETQPVETEKPAEADPCTAYWLLSLFRPGAQDTVDWRQGSYALVTRGGRVDATGDAKKLLRMVAEGSVVCAKSPPDGSAADVAPAGFPHPVFRYGRPVCIPIPARKAA